MTKLRWPNEYDRMNMAKIWWTRPKNWQQRTLTIEDDQKLNKYFDNDEP